LLPLYRRAFAKIFASGGAASQAIGFKGMTLSNEKLDSIIDTLGQGFGEINQRLEGPEA
jgi:hypothetical protein